MATDPNSISLTADQLQALAEAADRTGQPWPIVFSTAISQFHPPVARNGGGGSAFDHFQRAGLIGAWKDGPDDLSTNPRHMEGFGES